MTLDVMILIAAALFVICLGAYLLLAFLRGMAIIVSAAWGYGRREVPADPVEREPVDAMVIRHLRGHR